MVTKNNNLISVLVLSILISLNININCIKLFSHKQALQNVTYSTLKSDVLSQNGSSTSNINFQYYDNLNSPIANYYYGSITK
jgi:hypothetical protein